MVFPKVQFTITPTVTFLPYGKQEETIKKLFILVLIGLYLFRLWQSTGCQQFSPFAVSSESITSRTITDINTDVGISRNLSRFFHNKVTEGTFTILQSYLINFEPRHTLEILGPAGFVLLIFSIANILKNNRRWQIFHFFTILFLTFLITAGLNSRLSFYLFAASLASFSFWGINLFKKTKYSSIVFIFLALLTFWYFTFSWQLTSICTKIFFN